MTVASELELRPNAALCLAGGSLIALVSACSLPWTTAVASTVLGTFMIAGADVDARTCLLPDKVTIGALLLGFVFAPVLEPIEALRALTAAMARAAGVALILGGVRWGYARLRSEEGLGLGDIKLAAVGGAWLALAEIPLWLSLASAAALVVVVLRRLRGQAIERTTRIPFGVFLGPALWLVFFLSAVADSIRM